MNLLGVKGARIEDIRKVVSIPVATAQCRSFLRSKLPGVATVAANSTAEAAQALAVEPDPSTAAIGTALAAQIYGLDVLADDIEDHPENSTRFVAARPVRHPGTHRS